MKSDFRRSVLVRGPPKSIFQMLCDPTFIEEVTRWKVDGDPLELGSTWTERHLWHRRSWTITEFDRRGLSFTMDGPVTATITCKKGGTGSCNMHLRVTGEPRAVAKFEKTDGDRLDLLAAWLES